MKKELEKEEIWKNSEKQIKISKRFSELGELIERIEKIQKESKELSELFEIVKEDERLEKELNDKVEELGKRINEEEMNSFLSSPYDELGAVLEIQGGAGGRDAEDWATMLLRMYQRFAERKRFKAKILNHSFGEPGPEGRIGTKEVVLEIQGKYAYGFLRKEKGIHRLVRISPFSAQKLRHTSFASVDITPVFGKKEEEDIELKEDELRIDTFRASGPGGQYVNKRDSAIRITHLPTNITVACQSERSQGMNREKAKKILLAKLYKRQEEEKEKELKKLKGKREAPSWGNQIRSYVLHPYKMVKDNRTKVEISEVDKVLDGELDEFIQAEIKLE